MALVKDYAEQIRGVSYKPDDLHNTLNAGSITLLRANNIDDGAICFDDVVYVDRSRVKDDQKLKKGDILVCASSGSKNLVGKAAYIPDDLDMTFGAFCKVIRPHNIEPAFFQYFFQSPSYRQRISDLSAGANINNIRNEHIDEMSFHLPDLPTQRHIAATLDKVSEGIDLCRKMLGDLDEVVMARFVEMFGDAPEHTISFGDICIFLRNGANIKQDKNAKGYPITRIETISNNQFNLDRMGYANIMELGKYAGYVLIPGDILISHINSVAYLGRAVQYKCDSGTPIIHGMNLLCARIIPEYDPTYVEFFFKTKAAKDYIASITKKSVNQASITTSDLKKMQIPIATLEKQKTFASFVAQSDKSKFAIQQQLTELETLKKSLMQEYFG